MYELVYDGTFEGFFSVVFEVYERKLKQVSIRKEAIETRSLFAEKITIHTNLTKAQRVLSQLEKLAGREGVKLFYVCYLSEKEAMEDHMLKALQYLFTENRNVLNDYGDPDVLTLKQTEKMMRRERHRMTAFVRFQLASDGLYYSLIEPDFDVLPLLVDHFQGRYADQRWLIYDRKRHYGIYYDLQCTVYVRPGADDVSDTNPKNIEVNEDEEWYRQLWAGYFKHTNIPSRKNMKLHLQHVPRRYWKYLPEKTLAKA